jgi:hypothetical protein
MMHILIWIGVAFVILIGLIIVVLRYAITYDNRKFSYINEIDAHDERGYGRNIRINSK